MASDIRPMVAPWRIYRVSGHLSEPQRGSNTYRLAVEVVSELRPSSLEEVARPQYLELIGSLQHSIYEILFRPIHIQCVLNDPFPRILERQKYVVDVDHNATAKLWYNAQKQIDYVISGPNLVAGIDEQDIVGLQHVLQVRGRDVF